MTMREERGDHERLQVGQQQHAATITRADGCRT
jgi:hypothetical protein